MTVIAKLAPALIGMRKNLETSARRNPSVQNRKANAFERDLEDQRRDPSGESRYSKAF